MTFYIRIARVEEFSMGVQRFALSDGATQLTEGSESGGDGSHFVHKVATAKRGLRSRIGLETAASTPTEHHPQLLMATVIPTVDYASFVWSARPRRRSYNPFNASRRR
jgi:hypothetical protein